MTFFDPNIPADLALLNAAVRDHDEVDNVAEMVEWEVIEAYKQRLNPKYSDFLKFEQGADQSKVKVMLIGYDQDDPTKSDPALKEALRRTIADVVSTILLDYDKERGVTSERQGNRSITYGSATSWRDWPSGWRVKLSRFDKRTGVYAI